MIDKNIQNIILHILVNKCSIFDHLYRDYGSGIPEKTKLKKKVKNLCRA